MECIQQSKTCFNTIGSYRCECGVGFIWDSVTGECQDLNECNRYEWNLCEHYCKNTVGSYECKCFNGFRLMENKRNCTDIDECMNWKPFG
ncbi:hypothetical protein BLA29_008416, partial [Euroglyphus maynei]